MYAMPRFALEVCPPVFLFITKKYRNLVGHHAFVFVMKEIALVGVDYGSKLAGTTAVAIYYQKELLLLQSKKKEDADRFLSQVLNKYPDAQVFMDAPLSLPGVYKGIPSCEDYFYRAGDRELKAMSPMFLGGLTARAMRLKASLQTNKRTFFECYPAQQAKRLDLKVIGYKKENLTDCLSNLQAAFPVAIPRESVDNWHVFDALLALLTAFRYRDGTVEHAGSEEEGQIWF